MDRMIRASTRDAGHTDGASYGVCTTLQTTLYDLMQALQDETEPDEEHLVVDAVTQLLRNGQIRFIVQPTHAITTPFDEAFLISV